MVFHDKKLRQVYQTHFVFLSKAAKKIIGSLAKTKVSIALALENSKKKLQIIIALHRFILLMAKAEL